MATLAQPVARLGGPLWDEEVVPALRKRLESESRTLSKRMSAISLVSDDDSIPNYTHNTATHSSDMRSQSKPRPNGQASTGPTPQASTSSYQRSRTYSQPGTMVNGSAGKGSRGNDSSSGDPRQQPTRIPKPSQRAVYGNGNTPSLPQTTAFPSESYNTQKDTSAFPNSATHSTMVIPPNNRSHSGLLHETAPFPASPSASTLGSYPPPRASIDSEERPFEHWYRGEVSRNGGVGELRVGRQQEMLEIANYGHMMRGLQGKKPSQYHQQRKYENPSSPSRTRRRAGSIGGLTDMERQRESILFDDEYVDAVSRVLDEHPLTDVEGESDVASLSSRRYHQYHNQSADTDFTGGGDFSMATVTSTMTSPAASSTGHKDPYYNTADERSSTPQPRSSESNSRNGHGQYPPTRIPSRQPRRSTDSRSTTPTMHHPPTINGSYSQSKTPSPPLVSATNTNRSVSGQSTASTKKGMAPPSTPSKKRAPVKSLRGQKAPQIAKKPEVSQYPVPADAEDDLSNAIPSWTQPVPKAGNWDEVILPVVARQKGMNEYYHTAHGKPLAPKVDTTPEPAPGTFGYDASKYRRREDPHAPLEMDEFGQVPPQGNQLRRSTDDHAPPPTTTDEFKPYDEVYSNAHDETRLPARPTAPSPMPFAEYAPKGPTIVNARPSTATQQQQRPQKEPVLEEEEANAGCCKCTIM